MPVPIPSVEAFIIRWEAVTGSEARDDTGEALREARESAVESASLNLGYGNNV